MALADEPLSELLARFAARTPAPASGSAAAITCALAAALVEMAAAFEGTAAIPAGHEAPAADTRTRAGGLRERALALADADLASYRPVMEALRLPGDAPERGAAVSAALARAADVPFAIVQVAAEISQLAGETAERAGRHPVGDAATAAVLAGAACRAAAMLVSLNLSGVVDDRPGQAAEFAEQATVVSQQAVGRAERR